MLKSLKRTPKNYDGTEPTGKQLNQLLSNVLNKINEVYKERPDLILAFWPELIGDKLAPMAQAVSFQEGILVVKVKNSTLHSLLMQHEKTRLLMSLRKKFPSVTIRNIIFRIG
jgi:hypothetical protein